jgi:uncharacterized protein YodC (DUF2158 family)
MKSKEPCKSTISGSGHFQTKLQTDSHFILLCSQTFGLSSSTKVRRVKCTLSSQRGRLVLGDAVPQGWAVLDGRPLTTGLYEPCADKTRLLSGVECRKGRNKTMAGEIKAGDVVQLKSGGPKMTVAVITRNNQSASLAKCNWFDGAKNNYATFPVTSLKILEA